MDEPRPYRMVIGVRYRPAVTGRVVLGLLMMTFGALWTLDNMGVVNSGPILRWWPSIVLLYGLMKLLGIGTCRNFVAGALGTLFGGWLLAEQLDLIHMSFFMLWPLVFVVIGIGLITRSSYRAASPNAGDEHAAHLSALALLSGVVRKVVSTEFRGGEVTAFMGGVQLDLRGARTAPEGAVVDVTVCWGGVDITVPDTWRVVNEATVMLGGLEDRTKIPPSEARDTLILRGLVIMGGVEIKN